MSSDDVKRSVRTNRHDRTAGDAPNIGRVARMPGTGMPKGERRRRAKGERRNDSRLAKSRGEIVRIWSILVSALVVVVLGISFWLWISPKMEARKSVAKPLPVEAAKQAPAAPRFLSPSETDAIATVKKGLAIRDPERIPEFFRLGTVNPQEIVDFLGSLETRDGAIDRLQWLGNMDTNGLPLEAVVVNFKGLDKPRNRVAVLIPDDAGKWQIDFDSFARTVKPTWPELLEKDSEVAQVRVYMAKDNYYNGPFRDDEQWVCYGMASPDMDQILLGYAKTGSPQATAIERIFSRGRRMTRATLEIRRVPDGELRQFEISKVLAEDWVMGAAPFDERFK